MTFEQAMREVERVGVARANGRPLLAIYAQVFADTNPGLSAKLIYDGAIKKKIAPEDLRGMSPVEAGWLMFE